MSYTKRVIKLASSLESLADDAKPVVAKTKEQKIKEIQDKVLSAEDMNYLLSKNSPLSYLRNRFNPETVKIINGLLGPESEEYYQFFTQLNSEYDLAVPPSASSASSVPLPPLTLTQKMYFRDALRKMEEIKSKVESSSRWDQYFSILKELRDSDLASRDGLMGFMGKVRKALPSMLTGNEFKSATMSMFDMAKENVGRLALKE